MTNRLDPNWPIEAQEEIKRLRKEAGGYRTDRNEVVAHLEVQLKQVTKLRKEAARYRVERNEARAELAARNA